MPFARWIVQFESKEAELQSVVVPFAKGDAR